MTANHISQNNNASLILEGIARGERAVAEGRVVTHAQVKECLFRKYQIDSDKELRTEWLREASFGAVEINSGNVTPVPSGEVMKKARLLLE